MAEAMEFRVVVRDSDEPVEVVVRHPTSVPAEMGRYAAIVAEAAKTPLSCTWHLEARPVGAWEEIDPHAVVIPVPVVDPEKERLRRGWAALNDRRLDLIARQQVGALSAASEKELAGLQLAAGLFLDAYEGFDLDAIGQLRAELKAGGEA